MRLGKPRILILIASILIGSLHVQQAYAVSGVITGVVRDEMNRSLSNATIQLYNKDGEVIRQAQTNVTGTYRMDFFGNYDYSSFGFVEIFKEGYRAIRYELPENFSAIRYARWDAHLTSLPALRFPQETEVIDAFLRLSLSINADGRLEGRLSWGGMPMDGQQIIWVKRRDLSKAAEIGFAEGDSIKAITYTNEAGTFEINIDSRHPFYLIVISNNDFTFFQPVQLEYAN